MSFPALNSAVTGQDSRMSFIPREPFFGTALRSSTLFAEPQLLLQMISLERNGKSRLIGNLGSEDILWPIITAQEDEPVVVDGGWKTPSSGPGWTWEDLKGQKDTCKYLGPALLGSHRVLIQLEFAFQHPLLRAVCIYWLPAICLAPSEYRKKMAFSGRWDRALWGAHLGVQGRKMRLSWLCLLGCWCF